MLTERDIVRALEAADEDYWNEAAVLAQAGRDAVMAERGAE